MYNFSLNEKEIQNFHDWIKDHEEVYTGAIGVRYSFIFTPTSIGTAVSVRDVVTNEEKNITDYEDW